MQKRAITKTKRSATILPFDHCKVALKKGMVVVALRPTKYCEPGTIGLVMQVDRTSAELSLARYEILFDNLSLEAWTQEETVEGLAVIRNPRVTLLSQYEFISIDRVVKDIAYGALRNIFVQANYIAERYL